MLPVLRTGKAAHTCMTLDVALSELRIGRGKDTPLSSSLPSLSSPPALALYRRLLEKCQGRVARSDIGWAANAQHAANAEAEEEFIDMATDAEWTAWAAAQAAATHVTIDNLFVDYVLE